MSRSIKVRSRKKSSSKKQKREVDKYADAETATTETSSDLTEHTPLGEKTSRKQRKEEQKPTSLWYDLNLMCGGCCGAMEAVTSVQENEEEDLFADDDNLISKFGHSIMHKAGFAPPVKIIRCTQEDDADSVITTPKVLIELAKQYDKERFWASTADLNDDTDGTVTTSRTALSNMTSMSKRLIPNLSLSAGRSRASKSVKTMGSKKSKKSKTRSSDGRYEI